MCFACFLFSSLVSSDSVLYGVEDALGEGVDLLAVRTDIIHGSSSYPFSFYTSKNKKVQVKQHI